MKIPEHDIVEVISRYITLTPAGDNFVSLCPFHVEKSPSFNVNPRKQIFHCFGCHRGGSAVTFIQHIENISFDAAVEKLVKKPMTEEESNAKAMKEHEQEMQHTLSIVGSGALCKACYDVFDYALQLRNGTVIRFEFAKIISTDWLHLDMWTSPDKGSTLPYAADRGIDVRISDIVWVMDAPEGS